MVSDQAYLNPGWSWTLCLSNLPSTGIVLPCLILSWCFLRLALDLGHSSCCSLLNTDYRCASWLAHLSNLYNEFSFFFFRMLNPISIALGAQVELAGLEFVYVFINQEKEDNWDMLNRKQWVKLNDFSFTN